jgi:6-pyruvoyltetrahydropterin/6-carboxytetrahydropterin synthase
MGVKIELGRRYQFAASHRLHTDKFSEEENARVFGKCANPYGHGHNYVLEISVSGDVDPATGMIASLADLDSFVQREVLEVLDHKSLNEDVEAFRNTVPTTENLCIQIFERLKDFPKAKLEPTTASNTLERIEGSGREQTNRRDPA